MQIIRCGMKSNPLSIVFSIVIFEMPSSFAFAEKTVLQLMESEFQAIVQSVKPAVVEVVASFAVPEPQKESGQFPLNISPSYFVAEEGRGTIHYQNIGSGTLIGSGSHIVTTRAVVEGADEIEVVFGNGQRSAAELAGIDSLTDIAVLALKEDYSLQTKIGDSDKIRTGAWVITVGSSFGHAPTLSFGIVSGFEALPDRPYDAIKVNVAVNPGNSGGAVVNTSGEIIGIITATLAEPYFAPLSYAPTSTKLSEGQFYTTRALPSDGNVRMENEIGFAIPIKTVQLVAEQLIRDGKVRRGWLGVEIVQDVLGVRITKVLQETPAQKAGLRARDVITEFKSVPIHTRSELQKLVANSKPHTQVMIKIRRGRQTLERDVVLGERE